uniref:Phosphate transporter n=1 Tax=Clastoptera arizonana TaxID=38151 RepID=A0A1B6CNV5_9HEMI
MEPYSFDVLWLVILSFLVSFVLAFGIGANDVANSFGTSVGSKVLSVRAACWLATIFEVAGALLIGYKVSDTMRKGILQVSMYEGNEKELMIGLHASLAGSAIWLIVATFFKLPISGTHSIVGATVGFSLVCRGSSGISWVTLSTIVLSWFISPVLSGTVSVILFVGIRHFILQSPSPMVPGLRSLPIFYGITITINAFSVFHDGPKLLYFDKIPTWTGVLISVLIGSVVALVVQIFLVPYQRKLILDSSREQSPRLSRIEEGEIISTSVPEKQVDIEPSQLYLFSKPDPVNKNNGYILAETEHVQFNHETSPTESIAKLPINSSTQLSLPTNGTTTPAFGLSPNSSAVPLIKDKPIHPLTIETQTTVIQEEPPEVFRIFAFLQVLTATFGSFAHGGNDVSNAIGPLVAVWLIYTEGTVAQKSETPIQILLFGGIGISLGLWLWGKRVIQTVGEDLTKITASTGFTIEVGSALTVLLASKIGLPISTTHCKVGSVVFVGWVSSSSSGVDWKLFRNIISAWVVTVPVAAALSALFTFILRIIVL